MSYAKRNQQAQIYRGIVDRYPEFDRISLTAKQDLFKNCTLQKVGSKQALLFDFSKTAFIIRHGEVTVTFFYQVCVSCHGQFAVTKKIAKQYRSVLGPLSVFGMLPLKGVLRKLQIVANIQTKLLLIRHFNQSTREQLINSFGPRNARILASIQNYRDLVATSMPRQKRVSVSAEARPNYSFIDSHLLKKNNSQTNSNNRRPKPDGHILQNAMLRFFKFNKSFNKKSQTSKLKKRKPNIATMKALKEDNRAKSSLQIFLDSMKGPMFNSIRKSMTQIDL